MSTSAPPPPSVSQVRARRPWYLLAAMILAWLIGVQALSDSFATLLFLREGNLPDVDAFVRAIKDAPKPIEALYLLHGAAQLRSLGEATAIAFPLTVGRFLLSILLVLSSGMAMSGKPGARWLTMQALLANAALAVASFWLLRESRYAWIDTIARVRDVMPNLPSGATAKDQEAYSLLLERSTWLLLTRLKLIVFDTGALLLATLTLMSARSRAFFEAVAKATEQAEEP